MLQKYKDHIPCSFGYKLVCVDDRFSKPIILYRGENAASEFSSSWSPWILLKIIKKIFQQKFDHDCRRRRKFLNQVTFAGYVKNSLKMKKLEIIVT